VYWPTAARRAVAVLLVVLGLGVTFAPGGVPGFVEPDTPGAGMQMR